LRHGAVSQIDRLLGRYVDNRVYDLLRHIRYSVGTARDGTGGQGRPNDGGSGENSQASAACGVRQAKEGCAHGRRISWE
jgi:hypothetical protein